MKVLKRFFPYIKPIHHFLPEYLIFTILGILFGIINFSLLIPILEILFQTEKSVTVTSIPTFSFTVSYFVDLFQYYFNGIIELYGKMGALIFVCLFLLVCSIFSNFFKYMGTRVMIRLRFRMVEKLRTQLYNKYMHQTSGYYHNNRKGELIAVMTNEVQEIEISMINSLQCWLRDPLIIISFFLALFYISPQLTLFTILFFPIAGFLISLITKKLKKVGWHSQELMGKILINTEESLGAVKVIQSFVNTGFMQKKFDAINHQFSANSSKMSRIRELASPVSEVMGITVVAVLLLYGGYLTFYTDNGLTGPQFITYLGIYSQILPPMKSITTSFTQFQRGLVATEKYFSVLDTPILIEERSDAVAKEDFHEAIELKRINFHYDSRPVLKDINLRIQKGQTIALVGESGSGKSTIAELIPRFYDPVEGEILIDGKDLRAIKLADLRHLMSVVTQEAILFNDTVLNNIAFGQTNADPAKVIEAAKMANAHSFIEQMDHGYDTIIGDRGLKLSGGQRQRLTIARAIFKNAPILILDEATSALDSESELLVQQAINELMKNRTSVVIAHRLSTIRHADEIIVLSEGRIVERGSHETLLANDKGYYKKLIALQDSK